MKVKLILALLFLFLLISSFLVAKYSYADQAGTSDCGPNGCTLQNPLGNVSSPQQFIGVIIKSILGGVGSLALIMIIWGGIIWMTAAGSAEKVAKGKEILVWAVIGLITVFSAYPIAKFVLDSLAGNS